jgi:hypothetical protein
MTGKSVKGRVGAAIVAGLLLCLSSAADASLIGQQITHSWFIGGTAPANLFRTTQYSVTADAMNPELVCPNQMNNFCDGFSGNAGTQIFDIGDATISFTESSTGSFLATSFNGWEWSNLIWANGPGMITGVQLATDITNLDLSRVSFTANSVRINMQGLGYDGNGGTFTLTLETAHAVPIPTPGPLALLGFGLIGLGLSRRFKVG